MPLMEWSDDFSVGVGVIDADHKRLLGLLNELHDAVQAGDAHEVLAKVLDELVLYVGYHFAHEEELFLRTDYPGSEKHHRQHQALTSAVQEIVADFHRQAMSTLPQQVLEFLKNWLYEHILRSDQAFGAYYKALKIKPRLEDYQPETASAQ
jgi:hemerythrin